MTAASPAPRPSAARAALWLFLGFSVLYVALTRGRFQSTDEIAIYQTTQSLWEKGDLSVSPRLPKVKVGEHGKSYAIYSAGQSIAAVPLYAVGRATDRVLSALGLTRIRDALAGPLISYDDYYRWGGEVPIFFAGLFGGLATALLCAVFFAFNLRLGVSPRWALSATVLLGAASYVVVQATTFFEHSAEALCCFLAAYLLHEDASRPNARTRAAAGIAAGLLLLVRLQGVVALPALFLYLAWMISRRIRRAGSASARALRACSESAPFLIPIAAALLVHVWLNRIKFGHTSLMGGYGEETSRFHNPLLHGLGGLLFSPGEGLFIFCPLLLLLPWTMRAFWRRHAPEAALVAGIFLSYPLLYAKYDEWHGQWCFGPRYLTPIVPMLLLPLGGWMERGGSRRWLVVAPLAALGAFVALLGVAVDFMSVYWGEGYVRDLPLHPFIFSPGRSQLVTHAKSLFSMNENVDLWLVQVFRDFGWHGLRVAAVPLVTLLALAAWRAGHWTRRIRDSETPNARVHRPAPASRPAALVVGIALLATIWLAYPGRDVLNAKEMMKRGMEALYMRHDPAEAETDFRRVLESTPNHYGATFQLASLLDQAGKPEQARALWVKLFSMADAAKDQDTLRIVRERLARADEPGPDALMMTGIDSLYARHDPAAAAKAFREVLRVSPGHYGATYQLAVSLDQLGRSDEALPIWRAALAIAERSGDVETAATARARIAPSKR